MNLFLWAGISLSGNVNVSQKGEGSKALFFFFLTSGLVGNTL